MGPPPKSDVDEVHAAAAATTTNAEALHCLAAVERALVRRPANATLDPKHSRGSGSGWELVEQVGGAASRQWLFADPNALE